MSTTFRLGLFIVATLTILATGIFLIGDKQSLFYSTYTVRADFPNVAGLNSGADVRIGGIRKGAVRRILLPAKPGGNVTVMMDVERSTRDIVKKDSVAAIKTEGLLGDKYVEISFGSDQAEKLKDGESIQSAPPVDISNLIEQVNQILTTTNSAVTEVKATARNLNSVTTKIDQGKGTVGALINDKTIYNQAAAGTTALRENMTALKRNFLLRGFFKDRGYEDTEALKKNEIARLPPGPSLKSFTYDASRIFDKPDSAKLKRRDALNEAGQFLEKNQFGLAVVTASVGMKGDTDTQRVLTEARSMVVREYLAQNFRLRDTGLKTMGLGKTEGINDGGKLEIIIYPAGPQAR